MVGVPYPALKVVNQTQNENSEIPRVTYGPSRVIPPFRAEPRCRLSPPIMDGVPDGPSEGSTLD
jgi:hypothetical protein